MHDPRLWNEDLAPVPTERRTWAWSHIAALWVGMAVCIPTYMMAGDPDYDTSLSIMKALPAAGADVIELGMPFTDPMADGPSIQLAGQRALRHAGRDEDAVIVHDRLAGLPQGIAAGIAPHSIQQGIHRGKLTTMRPNYTSRGRSIVAQQHAPTRFVPACRAW